MLLDCFEKNQNNNIKANIRSFFVLCQFSFCFISSEKKKVISLGLVLFFFTDSEAPTRNIDFSPFRRAYRGGGHGSPATRSVQSEVSPLRSFRNFQQGNQNQQRLFATPPAPRRGVLPSPKPSSKPSWVQRHLRRRPQTVNVDDATLSGKIV